MSRKVELRRVRGPEHTVHTFDLRSNVPSAVRTMRLPGKVQWMVTVRHPVDDIYERKATHEEIDLWHQLQGERTRRAKAEVARLEREESNRYEAWDLASCRLFTMGWSGEHGLTATLRRHLRTRASLRRRLAAAAVVMIALWFAVAAVGGRATKPVVAPHAQIGARR